MMNRFNRPILKARKFAETPHCQYPFCDKPATDMHEIITRAETEGNEEARQLSFVPELTVALCREHHNEAHSLSFMRQELLRINFEIYGYERVAEAYERVMLALGKSGYECILQPDGTVFSPPPRVRISDDEMAKIMELIEHHNRLINERMPTYNKLCEKHGVKPRFQP